MTSSRHRILVVDDDPMVLGLMRLHFFNSDFDLVTTSSPVEAIRLIQNKSFLAVMSDHVMPEMDGLELLEKIREISPETYRVMFIAKRDMKAAMESVKKSAIFGFLLKPWSRDDVFLVLKEIESIFSARNGLLPPLGGGEGGGNLQNSSKN